MAPGAELILESTPDGVGGCFHEEWRKAQETGMVRHFFPWWMERRYKAKAVDEASLSDEERDLRTRKLLSLEQIGYRRQIRANFRGLARQEYAEDPESCFLASGESVFELGAIEARLKEAPEPVERRRNGELEIWLPPVKSKAYLLAVDPAGGGSEGDYSAAQVLEMETGLQCAEFAMRGVCRAYGRFGTSAAGGRVGGGIQPSLAGGGEKQSRKRSAGPGGDGMRIRENLSARGPGGVVDDVPEPAGGPRAVGSGAGGRAGTISEPAAAGGVPELCAHAERKLGSACGNA
jgi:hypothetical protein